jgi:Leucine-rich repeat (LRR) protein
MVVDLSNNQIIGNKVLAELFNLESLTNISLARNSLLSIPLLSKNSSRVKYLDLSNSNLSGTISSLARISSLLYLDLSHNNLSGSFPIDAQKLQFLNISFNNFSGRANDEDVRKFGPAPLLNLDSVTMHSKPTVRTKPNSCLPRLPLFRIIWYPIL